jgi:broad specificity phosphatase PhoE
MLSALCSKKNSRNEGGNQSIKAQRLLGAVARGWGMIQPVHFWCMRHAEAAPALPTHPLTVRGRHQAIEAAQKLAVKPITRIYSSTELRAQQTAELLAATLGLDIMTMPELIEVGCTAEELRAWILEQDLGQRAADGETGHQVVARVSAAFQEIASAHPGETVAVVGHVASLTVTLGRLCALGSTVWGTPLSHARLFLVEWDGQAWHCPKWPEAENASSAV